MTLISHCIVRAAATRLTSARDTSFESLKLCEHCGSEIETMGLADFLPTALS